MFTPLRSGRRVELAAIAGSAGAKRSAARALCGRYSPFNGIEMKGGRRGASASGSYGSSAPGGSGGGNVASGIGAGPFDARYGGNGAGFIAGRRAH